MKYLTAEKTPNKGQFLIVEKDYDPTLQEDLDDMTVVITRDRFFNLKELHLNKYKNSNAFWEMFERDLFEIEH